MINGGWWYIIFLFLRDDGRQEATSDPLTQQARTIVERSWTGSKFRPIDTTSANKETQNNGLCGYHGFGQRQKRVIPEFKPYVTGFLSVGRPELNHQIYYECSGILMASLYWCHTAGQVVVCKTTTGSTLIKIFGI